MFDTEMLNIRGLATALAAARFTTPGAHRPGVVRPGDVDPPRARAPPGRGALPPAGPPSQRLQQRVGGACAARALAQRPPLFSEPYPSRRLGLLTRQVHEHERDPVA